MLRRPDRALARRLLLLATLSAAGCAHGDARDRRQVFAHDVRGLRDGVLTGPPGLPPAQRVAGSWDLVERSPGRRSPAAAGRGPTLDQHELQLRWVDGALVGVWDRARTYFAGPGQHFLETGSDRCFARRRYLLSGRATATGRAVTLGAVGPLAHAPSSCNAPYPLPTPCLAMRRGSKRLELRCGTRTFAFSQRSEPALPLALALAGPDQVTGVWTWHHRSLDGEGDLKTEHETWHLLQRGTVVEGFYDRVVRMRSRDGRPFRCNDELDYRNVARFRVRGLVVAGEVYLKEVSYSTAPSDCETGQRRLDRYVGVLDRRGGQIRLRWRTGAQFLHRRH